MLTLFLGLSALLGLLGLWRVPTPCVRRPRPRDSPWSAPHTQSLSSDQDEGSDSDFS